jgi:hypothetical protein
MTRIAFKGSIKPAVFLSFKSIKVPGCHASADENFAYQVENESLFDFTLVATTPTVYRLERHTSKSKKLFDADLNTYIAEPIAASALNDIFDAHDAGNLKLFLTVKIWYMQFFSVLLGFLTRTAGDTFTLARPDDPKPVEDSFHYARGKSGVSVTHIDKQDMIKDIPCILTGWDIVPAKSPKAPPAVKLFFYMQLKEKLAAADRDSAVRIFLASDYSKVYRFGRNNRPNAWWSSSAAPSGIERSLKTWELNVFNFLFNHSSMSRGETIRQEIISNAKSAMAKSQLDVVQEIRDDIDARLITSNHWGDLREDWIKERYQHKLSDVFGAIHQTQWYASPVRFLRDLGTLKGFDDDQNAQLILQWGTGHCGEHTTVSFSIMREIMNTGNAPKFECIIYSGNANIDHAFVVGGIRVANVIHTTRRTTFHPAGIGKPVDVWDLRDTLSKNPGKVGFVLDPYLDQKVQARTARELLTALNAARRGAKKTDFLYYRKQHPVLPAPAEETRASVKAV